MLIPNIQISKLRLRKVKLTNISQRGKCKAARSPHFGSAALTFIVHLLRPG